MVASWNQIGTTLGRTEWRRPQCDAEPVIVLDPFGTLRWVGAWLVIIWTSRLSLSNNNDGQLQRKSRN